MTAFEFQANRNTWRSPTLVPVGPVWMRSPSACEKRVGIVVVEIVAAAERPGRSRARRASWNRRARRPRRSGRRRRRCRRWPARPRPASASQQRDRREREFLIAPAAAAARHADGRLAARDRRRADAAAPRRGASTPRACARAAVRASPTTGVVADDDRVSARRGLRRRARHRVVPAADDARGCAASRGSSGFGVSGRSPRAPRVEMRHDRRAGYASRPPSAIERRRARRRTCSHRQRSGPIRSRSGRRRRHRKSQACSVPRAPRPRASRP